MDRNGFRGYSRLGVLKLQFFGNVIIIFVPSDLLHELLTSALILIFTSAYLYKIMNQPIPFQTTNWDKIPATEHKGETGFASWKILQFGGLRIRLVEYSPSYKADHWCEKGHIIFCIDGEMDTELSDGSIHKLSKGMSYQVSDNLSSHRTISVNGVKLFIIDGDFLK